MSDHVHQDPNTVSAVDCGPCGPGRCVKRRLGQAGESRRADAAAPVSAEYLTISREAGTGGTEIATLVGQSLGWEVLDKNLVDRVAEESHLPRFALQLVDETEPSWAYDVLEAWLDPRIVPHEKYLVHLCRVVLAAARRGNVVVVGRGANFLLPRNRGLAVRLIASEKYRLGRIAERLSLDEAAVRRRMIELDHGRRDFVRRFFHHDVSDPHLYDMVLQVDRLGPAGAAEMIVTAYRNTRKRS